MKTPPVPEPQAELAAFLAARAGAAPIATHISLVFLAPGAAWKLRKAVRLSFLDFTSLAARERFARRELALNAPAAPGLYRDVVPLVRLAGGGIGFGRARGETRPVLDWVLRMARVPAADFLDAIADAGRLDPPLIDALADAVAEYHAHCPRARGWPHAARMRAIAAGNALAAREAGLDPPAVAAWEAGMGAALDRLGPWLGARARAGFVRRAHGDLHLGNLCLWHGKPVPFDALEFDEAMATIDLGYDLAFLLMDLDRRAGRAAANRAMNRYVARTGDLGMLAGLPAFLSMRALIRAHVAARSGNRALGRGYLAAASDYLRPAPARLVAVGGLQGSGKSTLARALAPGLGRAPGALVLRSDEIRKRLWGLAPERKLPPAAYAEAVSRRVFRALAAAAGVVLGAGQAVIADATFLAPAHRRAIARAAGAAPFLGLWLDAPLAVLEARVAGRAGDASDATVAVLRASAAHARPPADWVAVPARTRRGALAAARAALRRAGS
ncbi:MAG: AAA family ATPase [Rhodospirillales bacterium]|nr:AAA family ATPase [Rhodospirillales bacterium]